MSGEKGYSSLLVTCPGAYADSGLGTGGFVVVHDGISTVIDREDSTGIWTHDDLVLRFSRTHHALTATDRNGVRLVMSLPEARDVHDIAFVDGQVICVCSGRNEVLWFDLLGRQTRRWAAPGEGDAWHINCLWFDGGRMYLSAFGDFRTHRGWSGGCREKGFIFDVESGEQVMTGLSGPHNPRRIDGRWHVCDSHTRSLRVQEPEGTVKSVPLASFTRGFSFDDHYLYIGESADRKAEVPSDTSTVAVLERGTLQVVDRLSVPFPEIYEIVVVPEETGAAMAAAPQKFRVDAAAERIAILEAQMARSEAEMKALRERARSGDTVGHARSGGVFGVARRVARKVLGK